MIKKLISCLFYIAEVNGTACISPKYSWLYNTTFGINITKKCLNYIERKIKERKNETRL